MNDDLRQFRAEVREWLKENCPPAMREPYNSESEYIWGGRKARLLADQEQWLRRMADQGWTVPEWPRKYGGAGLSPDQRRILREEMSALGCRPPLHSFGIAMLAPALLKFGSEEQRLEHLPPMARGEIRWCQGYSEPAAGSDLASLTMSAVREGASYLVNGSKIWTSHADVSDAIFALVRTDATGDKRAGISFLLIDMDSPGISVSTIKLISGSSPFCQVFFDNVRVPQENLVGAEGDGWRIAKYLLAHERAMISGVGGKSGSDSALSSLARERIGLVDGRLCNATMRAEIARYEIDALSFRHAKRMKREGSAQELGALSSAFKYYGTELNKRRRELAVDVDAYHALTMPSGMEGPSESFTPTARDWLRSKANSIEGGTSEIQLNIIARRILNLP